MQRPQRSCCTAESLDLCDEKALLDLMWNCYEWSQTVIIFQARIVLFRRGVVPHAKTVSSTQWTLFMHAGALACKRAVDPICRHAVQRVMIGSCLEAAPLL